MKIKIPQVNGTIDLANPPENLETIIQEAFERYTDGTAANYRYEDKLMFLDVFRRNIYEGIYGSDDEEAVENAVLNYCRYELRNQGELPDNEEIFDMDFMAQMYSHGFRPFRFRDEKLPKRDAETIRRTILRIIIAVVNCETKN